MTHGAKADCRRRYTLVLAVLVIGGPVSAAEKAAPDLGFARKHIQVVEAPFGFNAPCDALPTGGDIARAALAVLERNRSRFPATRTVDMVGGKTPLDPDAIKVALSVQVVVSPNTPSGGQVAQSVETQLGFWWTAQPVAPLAGAIRTTAVQRLCNAALAEAIIATAGDMVQVFADGVAEQQRKAARK